MFSFHSNHHISHLSLSTSSIIFFLHTWLSVSSVSSSRNVNTVWKQYPRPYWTLLLWNILSEVNNSCCPWCCRGMCIWKHTVIFNLLWSSFLGLRVKRPGSKWDGAAVLCTVCASLYLCACSCAGWCGVQSLAWGCYPWEERGLHLLQWGNSHWYWKRMERKTRRQCRFENEVIT